MPERERVSYRIFAAACLLLTFVLAWTSCQQKEAADKEATDYVNPNNGGIGYLRVATSPARGTSQASTFHTCTTMLVSPGRPSAGAGRHGNLVQCRPDGDRRRRGRRRDVTLVRYERDRALYG